MTFFTQESRLPQNVGYELWDATYWRCIAFTALMIFALAMIFHKLKAAGRRRILHSIPVFMVLMEVSKQTLLQIQGTFDVGLLPLHLCSLGAYVFLMAEFLPQKKARSFFGEISLILILPGSLCALITPDWTMYPAWNYFNIYGYVWHGLLVIYPLLLREMGEVHPNLRHIWYEMAFLCAIVPPIMIFDRHFGCNFLFINWPIPHTILMWLASFMGNPGYLARYAVLVFLAELLVYGVYHVYSRIRAAITAQSAG